MAQLGKNPPAMWETWVQSLHWEELPEKGMATHSSILAWEIPWTKKPINTRSPRKPKNTRVGSLSLLQGIYRTQGSNLRLLHCRQILYHWGTREGPKLQLLQIPILGTSLVVQWLRLCALNTGGQGSIPSPGTRVNLLQIRVCKSQIKDPTWGSHTGSSQIN